MDDADHDSTDRHGQWSLHDRQTARSSACLLHTAAVSRDDDAATATYRCGRRSSGTCWGVDHGVAEVGPDPLKIYRRG